jgi:manganese transport protein
METENTIDPRNPSESRTVAAALDVLDSPQNKNFFSRLFPFLGPAFIASVAYIDPGNFATNIAAGAQFGYLLIWVIVVSNLMAMLVQTLSAKLGIVTGMNLAQHCRRAFPKPIVLGMWFLMELVAMATDLAEFLGAALGFNLLLGVPLFAGAVLTAITTFIILGFERYGFRPLEAVISGMVGVVTLCYIIETIIVKPVWKEVLYFAVVPHFQGAESVVLASGILGATVMPHAIFLHSALTQGRIVVKDTHQLKRLYRFEIVDVVIALGGASFVNAAMLIMAAATFHQTGLTHIASIEEAYRTLEPLLGKAAGWFFGLSLLVAGLSSSTVGTSAGQVIMEGFLNWHIPVWLRRLVTMAPSLIVIGIGLDPTHTLVMSQVILSFGLPFAIVPLVIFTARRDIMGDLVNRLHTTVLAALVAGIVILLNGYLLYQTFTGG